MTNDLAMRLEALLFSLGRSMTHQELSKLLGASVEEVRAAAKGGEASRGVVIVDDGKTLELRAAAGAAELIEKVRKDEYSRDIGKAGLEALASVLYRGPLTRAEIDFIRGVNSSQTLRTLTMRGLLRKIPNPKDERSYLYEPTTELLAQLGVAHVDELPEYAELQEKIRALEESYRAAASKDASETT